MATVFLAEDLKHGRRVAIKALDPEVAATSSPRRFLDCRLKTLESRVCRRHRVGDVPGEEIPALYYDDVK